jgi:hypothetical protein
MKSVFFLNLNVLTLRKIKFMKTKLFTITLAFISVNALAQITVTDSDVISVGDIVYQAVDTIPSNLITIGNSGSNQIWDFSSLQNMQVDIIEAISPVGTPYESIHPNANICVEIDDGLMYLNKSSAGLEMIGYGNVPLNTLMLPLPLVYGLNQQSGPNTMMDSVFDNAAGLFDNSLAPIISANPLFNQVDSLKIKVVTTSDFNVDAWGDITIPMGTYDALRMKVEETNTTEFFTYCSASGIGGSWFSAENFFPIETETINRYQWWSNDPTVKFMLAELEMDSVNNSVEFVTFLTDAQALAVNDLLSNSVSVFPNPTSDKIIIDTDFNNCNYELVDVKGSAITSDNFNYSTEIDLSKNAKGIYFLKLKIQNEIITKKIIID